MRKLTLSNQCCNIQPFKLVTVAAKPARGCRGGERLVISSGGDGKRKAREGVVSQMGKEEMAKWKQKCAVVVFQKKGRTQRSAAVQ